MPCGVSAGTFNIDALFSVEDLPSIAWQIGVFPPKVSRSQLGMDATRQALMRWNEPNELIAAHGRPGAPRLPRIKDAAVEPPRNAERLAVWARLSTKMEAMVGLTVE